MTGPMLNRLEAICRSTAAKWECEVLEFNGEADHVHLLLALTPKVLPSAFVNNLKTVTSRLLRKEFADHLKKNITGAIRYSGVAVIASSRWVVRHYPCSSNTLSNRKDRNDRPAGDSAASPPPEPLRGYRRSTTARSGRFWRPWPMVLPLSSERILKVFREWDPSSHCPRPGPKIPPMCNSRIAPGKDGNFSAERAWRRRFPDKRRRPRNRSTSDAGTKRQ